VKRIDYELRCRMSSLIREDVLVSWRLISGKLQAVGKRLQYQAVNAIKGAFAREGWLVAVPIT
jgi:hypothetical protein